LRVEGISDAIAAESVTAPDPRAPLLEREGDMDVLDGALAAAAAGTGAAVLVEGPAGIGKTRLLAAAAELARARGMTVLAATGSRLESDFAFGVVGQLLGPVLDESADRATTALPTGEHAHVDGVDRRYETLHRLFTRIAEMASERPAALLIDDLHWADGPSVHLAHFLLRRLHAVSVCLVLAARPAGEWAVPSLRDELASDVTVIRMRPLSPAAAGRLAEEALARTCDPEFVHACHAASGGNPFYLRELLREVRERDIEPVDGNIATIPTLGPESVAASVRRRLTSLEPDAEAVARAAATLGDGAALSLVAALAGISPIAAAQATDALRRQGILSAGAQITFEHPIVRAAVQEMIPAGERRLLHARAATTMRELGEPVAAIAAQILHSEPGMVPGAIDVLRSAAQDAERRGAPDVAAVHLRRALEERPSADERMGLLLDAGVMEALRREPIAREHLTEAAELATTPDDRLLAALGMWTVDSYDGRIADGFQVLRTARANCDGANAELVARLELELARATRSCRSTAAEGRERIAALRSGLAQSDSPLSRLALGLVAYDALLDNRPVDEVVRLVEQALPLQDEILERTWSQLLHPPLYTLIYCDRIEQAIAMTDDLVRGPRRRGAAMAVAQACVWRGLANLRAGALRAAEDDAHTALESATASQWRFGQAAARVWLAEIALERGDTAGARRQYDELTAGLGTEVADKGWTHHARLGRARVLLARGAADAALEEMLAVGRAHDQWLARCPSELPWRSDAALAAVAAGQRDTARRLAEEELELARAFGAPRALGVALRACAIAGDPAEAPGVLEEAIDVLEGSPARLERARALVELGATLRQLRRMKAAREPLRRGLEEALRCGATVLSQRARTELIAAGARPRREAVTGVEALTASELRVARLAADGASNPEIASALYLSRKTVEVHLSNAYRKLGISSRSKLPEALSGDATPNPKTAAPGGARS
jgi:DNA-binding CsgD family transcriptional regulator